MLTWTAQAIMGADMASTSNERMLPLFGEPILDLLDDKLPISQHVRTNVLHLIRLLVKSLRDGGTSASMVRPLRRLIACYIISLSYDDQARVCIPSRRGHVTSANPCTG